MKMISIRIRNKKESRKSKEDMHVPKESHLETYGIQSQDQTSSTIEPTCLRD